MFEKWGVNLLYKYLSKESYLLKNVPINRVTPLAIVISFIIGFVITFIIAVYEILFFSDLLAVFSSVSLLSAFILVNVVLILIEFWFLFHIGFQCVSCYIRYIDHHHLNSDESVHQSLIRAVLELAEPDIKRFGLNPHKVKKRYFLYALMYKTKVVMSNFIGKLIVKKLLTRAGLRAYAPLVAAPITGLWDAWITGKVLSEVRYRINGRLYVIKLIDDIEKRDQFNQAMVESLFRLVALRIETFEKYNINLDFLIVHLDKIYPGRVMSYKALYSLPHFEKQYGLLDGAEQDFLRQIALNLFAMKKGAFTRQEWTIIINALNIEKQRMLEAKKSYQKIDKCLL